jgi:hypothetical protein
MPFGDDRPKSFKVAGAAAWKDDQTLAMRWQYYETPHHDTVMCRFDGNRLTVEFLSSFAERAPVADRPRYEPRPPLAGYLLSS